MAYKIAPEIVSNSHPLAPLGVRVALIRDHSTYPSIGPCVGALWRTNDDAHPQFFFVMFVVSAVVNWKKAGFRILAAQGRSSHIALQTAPYDPMPRLSAFISSTL